MVRWSAIKTALPVEGERIIACVNEARAIIKQQCGQELPEVVRWEGVMISISTYFKPVVDILATTYYVHLLAVSPEKHLNVPLRRAEEALQIATSITTGTIIEAWENNQ
jgi:hypothetical protein